MGLLDWNNPPSLDAPKRRQIHAQFSDRLKLARAKAKRAKGPKNHATNKERSFEDRMKAALIAKATAEKSAKHRAFKNAVAAYWRGDTDLYPSL